MSKLMTSWLIALLCLFSLTIGAQNTDVATAQTAMAADSVANEEDDSLDASLEQAAVQQTDTLVAPMESGGLHQSLKTKFIEGNAGFMSLVALALVLGLAFCIERIFMVLEDAKSIRDIVAFPKNGSGLDLMMGSPSVVDEDQLTDAHIAIIEDDED